MTSIPLSQRLALDTHGSSDGTLFTVRYTERPSKRDTSVAPRGRGADLANRIKAVQDNKMLSNGELWLFCLEAFPRSLVRPQHIKKLGNQRCPREKMTGVVIPRQIKRLDVTVHVNIVNPIVS
jgi:hypothetical protein